MNLKNYSLAVAALLFFINGACVAQSALPQLPDTPAANQAKGWLEVFNAGDVEKRRAFLQKNYPSRVERVDRETAGRGPPRSARKGESARRGSRVRAYGDSLPETPV